MLIVGGRGGENGGREGGDEKGDANCAEEHVEELEKSGSGIAFDEKQLSSGDPVSLKNKLGRAEFSSLEVERKYINILRIYGCDWTSFFL